MTATTAIFVVTIIVSLICFRNQTLFAKLSFVPYRIIHHNEWYRIFTYGFVHADLSHLAFNMLSLYFFSNGLMTFFRTYSAFPNAMFVMFYVSAMLFSVVPQLIINYKNHAYTGIGASGAVVAVVFAFISLFPNSKIGIFLIPPIIPAYIFGVLYLAGTWYMHKKRKDNIDHLTHFAGAIIGIAMLWAFASQTPFSLWQHFISNIVE